MKKAPLSKIAKICDLWPASNHVQVVVIKYVSIALPFHWIWRVVEISILPRSCFLTLFNLDFFIDSLLFSSSAQTYVPYIYVHTLAGSGSQSTVDGIGTSASFYVPTGVCVDYTGTYLYVNDCCGSYPPRRIVLSSGEVSSILSGTSSWSYNWGLACDGSGGIFISSFYYNLIYYASLSSIQTSGGSASIVAGSASYSYGSTDSSTGTSALFLNPLYISLDSSNSYLYIPDTGNGHVRKMSTSSAYAVTTIAALSGVWSVVVDSSHIYAVTQEGYVIYRELLSSCTGSSFSMSTVYAGSGSQGYSDGPLTSASFYYLYSLSIDSQSNLYVIDYAAVRLVNKNTSSVSTLAGLAPTSGYVDGQGSSARFNSQYGGYVGLSSRSDPSTLFVSDYNNNRIRNISCISGFKLFFGSCVSTSGK